MFHTPLKIYVLLANLYLHRPTQVYGMLNYPRPDLYNITFSTGDGRHGNYFQKPTLKL